jgi:hypothetical protein
MAPRVETVANDVTQIGEGEMEAWTFSLRKKAEIGVSVVVRQGPKVDVFFTDRDEFDRYRSGGDFNVYDMITQESVKRLQASAVGKSKEYVVLIENNGGKGVLPSFLQDNTAEVEVQIEVQS